MKRLFSVLLVALALICVGCKKQHHCDEISWTQYNSVWTVKCNFKASEFARAHIGDTLKVYGWLHYIDFYTPDPTLISNKDNQYTISFSHFGTYVYLDNNTFYSLVPSNPYDSLLYVIATIDYYEAEEHFSFLTLNTIKISKTPDYEK